MSEFKRSFIAGATMIKYLTMSFELTYPEHKAIIEKYGDLDAYAMACLNRADFKELPELPSDIESDEDWSHGGVTETTSRLKPFKRKT